MALKEAMSKIVIDPENHVDEAQEGLWFSVRPFAKA